MSCEPFNAILREGAYAVTALSWIHISTERLFSGLQINYSDQRALIKENLVEVVLFLQTKVFKILC